MTPRELRADVPAFDEAAYLNFGAHGPSPRSVVAAATACLETHEYDSSENDPYEVAFGAADRARERIADLIGADPEEVALTESTTDGINRIATAIDFEPGDVVVRTDLEHPAGILPWQQLKREGVEVRVLETEDGRVDLDAYTDAVADARLVCFSALTWTHGTRLPVTDLVDIANDTGAFTLVDAVQVPGQQEMDVHEWGADAVAAAGHKWLLGPWGAGFLYIDHETADSLIPAAVGYRSVTDPTADDLEYSPGATRFEIGTTSPAPHAGLIEAIDNIEAIGIDAIESRIETLTDRLKAEIDDERLLSPKSYESGLVTIAVDDPETVVERCADENIIIRSLPYPEAVRVSVHAVSTAAEMDSVAACIGQANE
ncbi:aminotransferase class V-fold PLP-dependent enzyme [Halonotius terrestris]|uniref:Aminotransferase class V-fold PLP-dependent enzyme n=1 Tax=Halonotius terrestris TaxID=2487750 RepID=A0A8J8TAR2_9EURY|nr:aminotransferase class V-fold PLP-dependent enzyme [Halonotius terrestris]TQQ79269.1 aminotransferase class V-fold PLP-dependent enzyme [Halonotius terrestris]